MTDPLTKIIASVIPKLSWPFNDHSSLFVITAEYVFLKKSGSHMIGRHLSHLSHLMFAREFPGGRKTI